MKQYQILILIILIVVGSVVVLFTKPTKRGLDLAGGVRVVLQAQTDKLGSNQKWKHDEHLPAIIRVMRNRIDKFGVSEPVIQPKGYDQIVVELPDFADVDKAIEQLQGTARMEFRHLKDVQDKRHPMAKYRMSQIEDEDGNEIYEFTNNDGDIIDSKKVIEESPLIMTGNDIKPNSRGDVGEGYKSVVALEFTTEGRKKFADFTRRNVDEHLAIVLEDKILSAPTIRNPILDGKAVIEGNFTMESAQKLANYINGGALPVPLDVIQSQKVEATLGKASVEESIKAGIIGLALVIIFMLAFYLLPGFIADVALVIYAAITFAVFKLIPVTLTLPGIAAYIISIGMAIDANILIFERLKEELRAGKTLKAAIDAGFARAFTSIFDSNMCTAITSCILYYYGTGPIKGFALVLLIGVAISMFTAITVTRSLLYLLVNTGFANNPKLFGVKREWVHDQSSPKHIDIVKRMWIWFLISAIIIAPGVIALFKGGLKTGIDFTGGNSYQISFSQHITAEQLNKTFSDLGYNDSIIQKASSNVPNESLFFVRTQVMDREDSLKVRESIEQIGGNVLSEDSVGPTISKELTNNAFWAIVFASIAIILYLTIRFAIGGIKIGFRFGVCAVLALLYNVIVVIGAFAVFGLLFNWEIDSLFVTALLTIIGYSVHDTIVIFDRIRENMKLRVRGEDFDTLVNKSILQSITRSINTSFTLLLTLLALLIIGASSIRQFVIALIIGITIGAYSSIFNASQLLVLWNRIANRGAPQTAGGPSIAKQAPQPKEVNPAEHKTESADGEESLTRDTSGKAKSSSTSKKRKRRF